MTPRTEREEKKGMGREARPSSIFCSLSLSVLGVLGVLAVYSVDTVGFSSPH
jgi:hypothetical protein